MSRFQHCHVITQITLYAHGSTAKLILDRQLGNMLGTTSGSWIAFSVYLLTLSGWLSANEYIKNTSCYSRVHLLLLYHDSLLCHSAGGSTYTPHSCHWKGNRSYGSRGNLCKNKNKNKKNSVRESRLANPIYRCLHSLKWKNNFNVTQRLQMVTVHRHSVLFLDVHPWMHTRKMALCWRMDAVQIEPPPCRV